MILSLYLKYAMIKKVHFSLVELQDNLDKFIYYYNFKRTNQDYRFKGKIPYQKLLDVKRKHALPFPPIDSIILYKISFSKSFFVSLILFKKV